jgi:hypothetical protein
MIPTRLRFLLAAGAVAFLCGGCGTKAPIESLDARAVGDNVLVEGKIVLRGSMPEPDIFLVMEDGTEVIIDGKEMRSELRNLADMPIAIEGEMKSMRDDMPRIEARRYELLRWPTGELPLVGLVSVDMDDVVLAASNGKRYWIRGDLVGVIRDYPGAKVWVIGSLGDAGMAAPQGTIAYWVTGYGVLTETP